MQEELKTKLTNNIVKKLSARGIKSAEFASPLQMYSATVSVLQDMMTSIHTKHIKRARKERAKRICYLCMEFLIGRSLRNNAMNLEIFPELCAALSDLGTSFDRISACESDPGLGNGGLGRLAACFMESLASGGYYATGYSLCYENGLFRQRIVDGEQIELPDSWMTSGGGALWLVPRPSEAVSVVIGGEVAEIHRDGNMTVDIIGGDEVRAVPYDLYVSGAGARVVNLLRLWMARNASSGGGDSYNTQGSYLRALHRNDGAAEITRQLYPPDNYDEGKLLRLTQQYFLVSASLQSIIRDHFDSYGTLDGFENCNAIHINDTHPALCIPELMRILLDVYSYSWEDAWRIVTKSVSYTNHTVMPEALECWRVDLFKFKLPRIYAIVKEINRRFCADLWKLYPGDWDRISRMSVIAHDQVRMANLSVVASHTVNGVSKLHSDILRHSVFSDYYRMTPEKFTSVTNGIMHRRWLCNSNPGLSTLLDECIGLDYRLHPESLSEFLKYENDSTVIARLGEIKHANKCAFSEYLRQRNGIAISPDSVFDVQIKRLHEYKRQLLCALKIISYCCDIREDPSKYTLPHQTFIFGAKAAPGYYIAKEIIKLICAISRDIDADRCLREHLKVVFVEDYNVSVAEELIPSAEISEQISLAGKEASGTGNMKLMMNGAITIGTLDGANVEILEAVGNDNFYLFGLDAVEVADMWQRGYEAGRFYRSSERLKRAVDDLYGKIGGEEFSHIADYLINPSYGVADPYMCLADFDFYCDTHRRMLGDYTDPAAWNRKSLVNIASSGRFASDVSIAKYAADIWKALPVSQKNKIKIAAEADIGGKK